MKKVNMETNYNVMKEVAKELGLKFVGIKKEDLVNSINNKIDEMEKSKKENKKSNKWYDQENAFPYQEGDIAFINTNFKDKGIHNRMIQIQGPSTKKNAVKVKLYNPKTGETQKTCFSLDFGMFDLYSPQYPTITNLNLPMVI